MDKYACEPGDESQLSVAALRERLQRSNDESSSSAPPINVNTYPAMYLRKMMQDHAAACGSTNEPVRKKRKLSNKKHKTAPVSALGTTDLTFSAIDKILQKSDVEEALMHLSRTLNSIVATKGGSDTAKATSTSSSSSSNVSNDDCNMPSWVPDYEEEEAESKDAKTPEERKAEKMAKVKDARAMEQMWGKLIGHAKKLGNTTEILMRSLVSKLHEKESE